MFTGIIDHAGTIVAIEKKEQGVLFRIKTSFSNFVIGESISVDGVCLTVISSQDEIFNCELSPETLHVSIAGQYKVGQEINLERALCLGDRMGGHFVTGHVDAQIFLNDIQYKDEFTIIQFSGFSNEALRYLIPKGSVTINGVSLTINEVDKQFFSVTLIPHTLERTNLSKLKINDRVNVEWDYLAKIVAVQVHSSVSNSELCV